MAPVTSAAVKPALRSSANITFRKLHNQEGIAAGDLWKAAKIPVESQDLVNAVLQRQGDQVRVMRQVPGDSALLQNIPQDGIVVASFRKYPHHRRLQKMAQSFQSFVDG